MNQRVRIICFLLAALLLCSACGGIEAPDAKEEQVSAETTVVYEYSETYVRLIETCGTGFVLQDNVLQTEVGSHIYRFEQSISEDERATFIQGQEALCALLDTHGISTEGLCFFVLQDYTNWTDSENRVAYYCIGSRNSWKQALTTVQLALGDYTNYGYLYALADSLSDELCWLRDDEANPNEQLIDGVLVNLAYPCFDEFYSSPEDIAACKALSTELLSTLDDPWSEEAFLLAREHWAAEQEIVFDPSYLSFAYAGPSCKLKIRGKYLEIFRTNSFTEDNYYEAGYSDEDYMASLSGIIRGVSWLEKYLTQLRETFGVVDPALLPVYLTDDAGKYADITYSAYFSADKNGGSIQSMGLPILAHEYVHYLFWLKGGEQDKSYESWIEEAVACYYELPVDFEALSAKMRRLGPSSLAYVEEMIGKSWEGIPDFIRYLRLYYRSTEGLKPYKYYLITVYDLRGVFGDYFVRSYGEDVFLEWALHPSNAMQLTGRTTEQIVNDWCKDMDDAEKD